MGLKEGPNDKYTVEEAIAMLPDGEMIHTFVNPAGMLLGADWSREDVVKAINGFGGAVEAGPTAQGLGHGLVIEEDGRHVFIETRKESDAEQEEDRTEETEGVEAEVDGSRPQEEG